LLKKEKIEITEHNFNDFVRIINEISGIDLSDKKQTLLIKFGDFLTDLKINTFQEFLDKLRINKDLRQETLNFVTIGETYFMRELTQLKEIIYYVKSLDKKAISILSAPCSSGEEIYSLAILAAQNFMKDLHILGIDINSNVIAKARAAKYQGRTLSRLSQSEKRRFFTEEDNIYSVNKNEICLCKFEQCNVFEDRFLRLGKFDIIVSRNMMIYFDYESKIKLMEHYYKVLKDEGRLYVGNADLVPENGFFKKSFSRGILYYEKIL